MPSLTLRRRKETADEKAPQVRTEPVRRRRRVPWIAAGVLLVAVSVAAFVLALSRVSTREPVLAVTRDVATGEVLAAEDVTVVEAGVDATVPVVTAAERERLVGRVAAGPLPAGSLLAEGMLHAGPELPAGMEVVGVAVPEGAAPVGQLAVGDRVRVVSSAPTTGTDDDGGVLGTGQVWAVSPLSDVSGAVHVSVAVGEAAAPAVAAAAGRDEVRLVWLGSAP